MQRKQHIRPERRCRRRHPERINDAMEKRVRNLTTALAHEPARREMRLVVWIDGIKSGVLPQLRGPANMRQRHLVVACEVVRTRTIPTERLDERLGLAPVFC